MLKETETEEKIVFCVTFFSLVEFRLEGGRAPWVPPGYAYGSKKGFRKNFVKFYFC